jgi:hypothetical protein
MRLFRHLFRPAPPSNNSSPMLGADQQAQPTQPQVVQATQPQADPQDRPRRLQLRGRIHQSIRALLTPGERKNFKEVVGDWAEKYRPVTTSAQSKPPRIPQTVEVAKKKLLKAHKYSYSTLVLWGRGLKTLPDCFRKVPRLQTFIVNNHCLKWLPVSLGDLPRLKLLDVSYNQLGSLPAGLFKMRRAPLKIYVRGNPLTSLPLDNYGSIEWKQKQEPPKENNGQSDPETIHLETVLVGHNKEKIKVELIFKTRHDLSASEQTTTDSLLANLGVGNDTENRIRSSNDSLFRDGPMRWDEDAPRNYVMHQQSQLIDSTCQILDTIIVKPVASEGGGPSADAIDFDTKANALIEDGPPGFSESNPVTPVASAGGGPSADAIDFDTKANALIEDGPPGFSESDLAPPVASEDPHSSRDLVSWDKVSDEAWRYFRRQNRW